MCKLFLSYISPLVLYLKNEHSTKSSAFVDFEVQITRSVIEGYFLSLALGLPLGAKIWENRGSLRREMTKQQQPWLSVIGLYSCQSRQKKPELTDFFVLLGAQERSCRHKLT